MIKQQVNCDITGKELSHQGMKEMTTCSLQYRRVAEVEFQNSEGKLEKKRVVQGIETYSMHLCEAEGLKFLKYVQDYFIKNGPKP